MSFKVALIQMACLPAPEENLARAVQRVEEAAREGARVVCLPELFRSQYFCQREDAAFFDLAETIPGPTTEALGKVARQAEVVIIAPIFERRAAGLYHNSAAVIDATGQVAGWHPEEKSRYGAAQHDAWRTVQRGHAIANGVFVAAVNRVGHEKPADSREPGIEFWGGSFISDPFGVVIAEAGNEREEIIFAEVDLARIEEVRRNWPFLRDRRIDAYAGLDRRFLDKE